MARADSLAMRALQLDKRFVSAITLRGNIAAKRAWMSLIVEQPPNPMKYFDVANEFATRAIALDEENAAAHELRGAIGYWRWLLSNGADSTQLSAAEAHLRKSIRIAGELPRAESVLSLLLQSKGDFRGARIAARKALQADAYLSDADQIVNRLFDTSFQLGDDTEAARWCEEVRRRFTGQWPGSWCEMILMGWNESRPADPRKALHLLATFGPAESPPMRAMMQPRMQMLAAGVVARAGQLQRADSLLADANRSPNADTELLALEAAVRIQMGNEKRAVELLRDYLARNPSARSRILNSRMYRDVVAQLN
jgi:tetratricopeptide (TPR) repeat protein